MGFCPLPSTNGQLHRNHLAAKTFAQGIEGAFAIGAGMIHLVDHDHPRQVKFFAELPHPPGHGLDAAGGVHDQQRRFHRQQRGARLMHKHGKARSIDKIDLYVVPLGECQRILHGGPARYIFFVIGGYRAAVIHAAQPFGHFGGLQKCGDQGGFAAVRVTHQGDITNVLSLIGLQ